MIFFILILQHYYLFLYRPWVQVLFKAWIFQASVVTKYSIPQFTELVSLSTHVNKFQSQHMSSVFLLGGNR